MRGCFVGCGSRSEELDLSISGPLLPSHIAARAAASGQPVAMLPKRHENANRTRSELIAEILREYERAGDAMRYLNTRGQIAWKACPSMLQKLADAEREVEDDMEDRP
jgi:hypothetical protein